MLNTKSLSEKTDKEESVDYTDEINIDKKWIIKKLKLCQRFLICMELSNRIKNKGYLISSMLYCYHTVIPFLNFENPPEFVIHILMKCHSVFMEREYFEKSTVDYIYNNYFPCLTYTLIYFLNLWQVKDELYTICRNTLSLINSCLDKNKRMIPSSTTIDHLWSTHMEKFKKTLCHGKKCPGQIEYLHFATSSIFSNHEIVEKPSVMVNLADYVDFILQLNDSNIMGDKKGISDSYTTMADIEYGINVYSLDSMYAEINKYKKSKRYLEMIYKLLTTAFKREEYDFIYKVYFEIMEWLNKRNFYLLHVDELNNPEVQKQFKKIKGRYRSIFKSKHEDSKNKKKTSVSASSRNSRASSTDRSICSQNREYDNINILSSIDETSENKTHNNSDMKSLNSGNSEFSGSRQRSLSFDDKLNEYNDEKSSSSFYNNNTGKNLSQNQDRESSSSNPIEKKAVDEKVDFSNENREKERKLKAASVLINQFRHFWRKHRYRRKRNELINYEYYFISMIHSITANSISRIIEKEIIISEIQDPSLAINDIYIDIGNYYSTGHINDIYDKEAEEIEIKDKKNNNKKDNKENKPNKNEHSFDIEEYSKELLECYIKSMVTASRSRNWNVLLLSFHKLWNFIGDMRKLEIMRTKYWRLESWKPFYKVSIELLNFLETYCSDSNKYNKKFDLFDIIKNNRRKIFHYYYTNNWGHTSDIKLNVNLILKFFIDTMEYLYYSDKYALVISFGIRINQYFEYSLTEIISNIMYEAKNQYNIKNPDKHITLPEIYENYISIPDDSKSIEYQVIKCKSDFIKFINVKYSSKNTDDPSVILRKAILNYEKLIQSSKDKNDLHITAVAFSDLGNLLYESGDINSAGLFWSKSVDVVFKKKMVVASINILYDEIKNLSTTSILKIFNNSIYILILTGFQLAKIASYCCNSNLNGKLNITLCSTLLLSKALYSFINEPHVPKSFIFIPTKTSGIINIISEFFKDQSSSFLSLLDNLIVELESNNYPGLAIPLLAFQLIISINNCRSLRKVIFIKLKYAKILIKCGFINEGLRYYCNIISGKGIFDLNPLHSLNIIQGNNNTININTNNNMNNSNNFNNINNLTSTNSGNNLNSILNVKYNNMEGLYESNNLNCIRAIFNTKVNDRLMSQYGKMMAKVIDFERLTYIIEIFNLYHGNFVYYDPIKNINEYLSKGDQIGFDIKSIKDLIYRDVLGYKIRKEKEKSISRPKSNIEDFSLSEEGQKKDLSFDMEKDSIQGNDNNNVESSKNINIANNNNSDDINNSSNTDENINNVSNNIIIKDNNTENINNAINNNNENNNENINNAIKNNNENNNKNNNENNNENINDTINNNNINENINNITNNENNNENTKNTTSNDSNNENINNTTNNDNNNNENINNIINNNNNNNNNNEYINNTINNDNTNEKINNTTNNDESINNIIENNENINNATNNIENENNNINQSSSLLNEFKDNIYEEPEDDMALKNSSNISNSYSSSLNSNNTHSSNKYLIERNERVSILKNIEENIYRCLNDVFNETKLDNKPYRPYQINFFCYCILKLVDIYGLLDKNRRSLNLLLSLSDFINKKVNALSDYLDSIKVEDNSINETINNLIDRKTYEENLLVDSLYGPILWLEIKKQTALNALVICDYNYALMTAKSGLKDATSCKSSNYQLEFLKIIICSKINLHNKNVKKFVGKFEEILKSSNLTLKSKFEGYIFYFDVTSKLNIYTYEEILNNRSEVIENYFYDLIIPQSLVIEDINKLTKYSPYYTDYVIYLYQQAVIYKSTGQYDLSLKCVECAINIMKNFVNISSFICLPILNKILSLLMLKENDVSTLRTIDSVCRMIIDIAIQEGGYNIRALKHSFSGLFISSIKINEIFEAINHLYAISIIGTIIKNIRVLNVNAEVKALIMDCVIKSKAIQNEVKLWYAKENQLYEAYDKIFSPLDITTIKSRADVKEHVHISLPNLDENKINEKIYLYYKYLFFDTNILDNVAFDYYSCSKMSRLQRAHQILLKELPEDVLSEISISRLLNINQITDTDYMSKFENMWMAQWFNHWNLPCDYEYTNADDESPLNNNEKEFNSELCNKKIVLVIYHLDITQNKEDQEIVSKIKKLQKELLLNRTENNSKIDKSSPNLKKPTDKNINNSVSYKLFDDTIKIYENSDNNNNKNQKSNYPSCENNSNDSTNNKRRGNSVKSHNKGGIFSSLSEMSKFKSDSYFEPISNSIKRSISENIYKNNTPNVLNEMNINKNSNNNENSNYYNKPSIIENTLSNPEDIIGINKDINENKEIYNKIKIRNKYYNMNDFEIQFIHGNATGVYNNISNENSLEVDNPIELELKKLFKKLYKRCIYTVRIPKTIVKEVQFICARNETDSKNFFFTKKGESSILGQKLKKDLINDIIKYIVGPEIEYVSFNNISNIHVCKLDIFFYKLSISVKYGLLTN